MRIHLLSLLIPLFMFQCLFAEEALKISNKAKDIPQITTGVVEAEEEFSIKFIGKRKAPPEYIRQLNESARSQRTKGGPAAALTALELIDKAGGTLDNLVNLGAKVMTIVKEETKSSLVIATETANALPKIVEDDWTVVTGWSEPQCYEFEIKIRPTFGEYVFGALGGAAGVLLTDHVKTTTMRFMVSYVKGGSLAGRGKFIKNLGISIHDAKMGSGKNLTITAQAKEPYATGSPKNPVANMELYVFWQVNGSAAGGATFLIKGEGEPKLLNKSSSMKESSRPAPKQEMRRMHN